MNDSSMNETLTAEEQKELAELERLVKLKQKAKRLEEEKAQALAEQLKVEAAAKARAYADAQREKIEASWKPAGEITIPARCPRCGAELKKKPLKGMIWQCTRCGDHRHNPR